MSRTLKRVPINFNWPLNEIWGGFINPYYQQSTDCPDCENGYDRVGGRPDANAALFSQQWYGRAPFDPVAYGAEPLSQFAAEIWQHARRNIHAANLFIRLPSFDKEAAIMREARRLYDLWHNQWNHHLIQADVDALVTANRLWSFTRVPVNDEQREIVRAKMEAGENSWLPYNNGHHPTAAEVNAWSLGGGLGHDDLDRGTCVQARCAREDVPCTCARCAGSGKVWPSPEIKQRYEDWEPERPPTGDGFQLWEDCSEGSPISPVFGTLDDLCAWAEDHATTFASFKATKAAWLEMLTGGVVHHQERNMVFM